MLSLIVATFVAVLVAELVGDKALYTLGTLATRFSPVPVFTGAVSAFMLKAGAAVLLGSLLSRLPAALITALSVVTFVSMAIGFWRRRPKTAAPKPEPDASWSRPVMLSFTALFLSEWADVGQLTAATLVARTGRPGSVWIGSTLALLTKAAFAVTVGVGLRRWVRAETLRYLAIGTCSVMAVLALFHVEI